VDNHSDRSGMGKICAKMVPKLLNQEQRKRRVQVCHDTLKQLETEATLLERLFASNVSWIFEHDPEIKRQSF